MRSIILLSALLACAAASAGDVYKWKDKDGRVHYGDKPKDAAAEAMTVESGSGTGEPSENEAARLAREKECQAKKTQIENWRKAPKISEVDNLGKERDYTPAEKEQFIAIRQKAFDEACAPRAPSAAAAGTFPPPEEKYTPVEPPPEEKQ